MPVIIDMSRIILFCLLALLPSVVSAQTGNIIRGDCTPDLCDDGVAGARAGRLPRRLPAVYSVWDSTRVYRQAVVLISFSDRDFKMENPRETYDSMFNSKGFNKRLGPGCVADYLREQSGGRLNMQFDVYGPVKVSGKAQPYEKPTSSTRNYGKGSFMEATRFLIDSLGVDFTPYDWDGEGEVNQVIYVCAGLSGNQSAEVCYGYVWPNTGSFSTIKANGKSISNYTASAEQWSNGNSCGIGTILHEFTHSLGLPDIYPTSSSAGYSIVDEWDLMDGGNFTNYGWCPPSYTPLEKMLLGWLEFTDLEKPLSVRGMKPLAEGGVVYRIKHTAKEWLLLENRQQQGWDAGVPGKGLLVWHVYYNSSSWSSNSVNNDKRTSCFELINADNMDYDAWDAFLLSWEKPKQYVNSGRMNSNYLSTSPYPWSTDSTEFVNDSLTNYSVPKAQMINAVDGSNLLSKPITNIVQHDDGTIDFDFMGGDVKGDIKGDVNGDGVVDVADISAVIDAMARVSTEPQSGTAPNATEPQSDTAPNPADVNGDGVVDVADISAVISIMAGEQ